MRSDDIESAIEEERKMVADDYGAVCYAAEVIAMSPFPSDEAFCCAASSHGVCRPWFYIT